MASAWHLTTLLPAFAHVQYQIDESWRLAFGPALNGDSFGYEPASVTADSERATLRVSRLRLRARAYLLQSTLTVPLSDYLFSTPSALDAADLNEQSATTNRDADKLEVSMRTKILYYEWVRTTLQVVVASKSVEQTHANLSMVKIALEGGRGSKADVLNAESLVAVAELGEEKCKREATLAAARLRVAMHDKSAKYQIGEDVFANQPKTPPQSFDSLVAEAQSKRLELRALDQANRSLAERTDVSSARGFPKLEAFGNAYYSRPNHRYLPAEDEWNASWDVGVQLAWSPNDWGTSSAETRTIEAERSKLLAKRDTVIDKIQEEVIEAYTSVQEAEIGVKTAQRNLVAAEEAYRVQKLFYENGRGTTLDLLETEARLLHARVETVNMRVTQHIARVALAHAVGRDVLPEADH